jgi:hypothetical protein
MIKRFIIRGVSKKFKGVQKLKPQKVPKSVSGITEQELAQKQFKVKFGDKPQFLGFGEASAIKLAGEELAGKTSRKTFFKTFMGTRKRVGTTTSALGRSRTITAIGVKSIKKAPKKSIIKAKQKGAIKAFETARTKEDKVFVKTLEKFTGRSKKPHFKTFWKKLDKPIKW